MVTSDRLRLCSLHSDASKSASRPEGPIWLPHSEIVPTYPRYLQSYLFSLQLQNVYLKYDF